MVFVWSNLVDGEPHFTLSQVALNDAIMVVAFAPIVGLLLGLSSISVPWDTLLLSVLLYIVVPVIVAQLWRQALLPRGGFRHRWMRCACVAVVAGALLLTLVLLFGLQGEQIVRQPLVIALGGSDHDAGLFQRRPRVLAQPPARRRVVHRRALGADRRLELLRTRRGDGDRAVRLPVRRRACDGGRRAGRGR